MTTTEHALLAGILAAPDDDLPRLVFADRLDEIAGDVACGVCHGVGDALVQTDYGATQERCLTCHGTGRVSDGRRERAEFIRVQCELARYEEKVEDSARADHWWNLKRRERVLRDTHSDRWRLEATGKLGVPLTGETWFSRGFVSSLTLSAADWLRVADAVYWHPGQTVECPECEGRGWHTRQHNDDGPAWAACQRCKNDDGKPAGRIPRPFVPTAHPIAQVTLTTWPEDAEGWPMGGTRCLVNGGSLDYYEFPAWPGITFHTPATSPTYFT